MASIEEMVKALQGGVSAQPGVTPQAAMQVLSDADPDPINFWQQFAASKGPYNPMQGFNPLIPDPNALVGSVAGPVVAGKWGASGSQQAPGGYPKGYLDKVPVERRIARTGVSHPGYRFEVYDKRTGQAVGQPYSNSGRARGRVDKLDNQYGGYKYGTRPVQTSVENLTETEVKWLKDAGFLE